jgi:hypothetical protein
MHQIVHSGLQFRQNNNSKIPPACQAKPTEEKTSSVVIMTNYEFLSALQCEEKTEKRFEMEAVL